MSLLWNETLPITWHEHLQKACSRLESLQKPRLVELDRWRTEDLTDQVKAQEEAHLTKEDVIGLVEWKLTRGKWRPKLLDYATDALEQAVVDATQKAYASLRTAASPDMQQVEEALKELTTLKGVGPATASAMLTVYSPSLPFMSDEALAAAVPGRPEYTVKKYIQLVEALRDKAAALTSSSGTDWTAAQVERALWSASLAQQASKRAAQGTKRKR